MSVLVRVNYVDQRGILTNEWFPTELTGADRCKELDTLGMESVDMENVHIPWEGELADLIHWLNENPNTPPLSGAYLMRSEATSTLENQVGGDHYKKLGDHQPWAVLTSWLTPDEFRGFMKGQAIVYLARERDKGGDEDVAKAAHYLEGLLQLQKGE